MLYFYSKYAIKLIENLMNEINMQKDKTIEFTNYNKAISQKSSPNTGK